MSSITCPEDVVNLALLRIGYTTPVSNLYEGSRAADAALKVYGQTRDELQRQNDWGFNERNVALTLLKQAPAAYIPPVAWDPAQYPALPWLYEYGYPNDCLKVRALKGVPLLVPNFDPQPNVFTIANDNAFAPPRKVILCNVPAAVLTYSGQVTDPATWESDFIEALAAALGRRIAPGLAGMEPTKLMVADEANAKAVAELEQG